MTKKIVLKKFLTPYDNPFAIHGYFRNNLGHSIALGTMRHELLCFETITKDEITRRKARRLLRLWYDLGKIK
jgi:hypothetical protein